MKSFESETSALKLRVRLLTSSLLGFFLFAGAYVLFRKIQTSEREGGAPSTFRRSFLWNEEVAMLLRSNKRLGVKKDRPPAGKTPRVNGDLGLKKPLDLANYVVRVQSEEKDLRLTVTDFKLLPKSEYDTEFMCIEGWSEDLHYGGARFSDFMRHYGLGRKKDGRYYEYVGLETPDGEYYVSIDMESMLHEQTVLAWEMNAAPLSPANGAPLRLVIPIKYGIKSLKRIGRIFFSDSRPRDYWAERGYDWYSGL